MYLSVGDRHGMMVSLIQSNYYGFGSGLVVPGTGIALNDRGAGFTLRPGHPNEVAGGKRPLNTIIPGFLTAGGEPVAAFGVMGGPMQPQGHVQVMHRLMAGQSVQEALDARLLTPDGRVEVSASALGLDAAAIGGADMALERVLADPLLAPVLPAGASR